MTDERTCSETTDYNAAIAKLARLAPQPMPPEPRPDTVAWALEQAGHCPSCGALGDHSPCAVDLELYRRLWTSALAVSQRRYAELYASDAIGAGGASLEEWVGTNETEAALNAVLDVASDRRKGAWLAGPSGTGKTHLAGVAVREALKNGTAWWQIRWLGSASLLVSPSSSLLDAIEGAGFVVLDGLETCGPSWLGGILLALADQLWQRRSRIIVTSNSQLSDLCEAYHVPAAASRFGALCGRSILVDGPDFRLSPLPHASPNRARAPTT